MSKYELSDPTKLGELLDCNERLGKAEPHTDLGCQFIDIDKIDGTKTNRGPRDQVLIALEPGGRSPFVTLAMQKRVGKRVDIWPAAGRSYGVVHRANGTLTAQVLDTNIAGRDRPMTLRPGDSFGFVNPTEGLSVIRDEFYPYFVEEDEESVPPEVETILLTACGLAMAAEARRVALALA